MNRKEMAEIKCPVCGKVGIPDYHVQDTICPQCGSDLSIYKLAHDIETVSTQIDGKKVSPNLLKHSKDPMYKGFYEVYRFSPDSNN